MTRISGLIRREIIPENAKINVTFLIFFVPPNQAALPSLVIIKALELAHSRVDVERATGG